MNSILLIHWKRAEAEDRVQRLREAGFSPLLLTSVPNGPADLKRFLKEPVDAIVIDLSRRPSLGRDVVLGLRGRKITRHIPIVFVDGGPDKVSCIKRVLPDATFTQWPTILDFNCGDADLNVIKGSRNWRPLGRDPNLADRDGRWGPL